MSMNDLGLSPEEYNEEVFFCKSCHSLKIILDENMAGDDWDGSYCGKCHSTNIGVCTIGEWLEEEARRKKVREAIEWNK